MLQKRLGLHNICINEQREHKHSEQLKVQETSNDKAAKTNEQPRIAQDLTSAAFFESAVPLRKYKFLGAEYPRTA